MQPDSPSDLAQAEAEHPSPSGEQTFTIQVRPNHLDIDTFPPEIKNMIYSYVFEKMPDSVVFRSDINGEPRVQLSLGFTVAKTGSIFRVNKSLSKEARSWLYSSRQFTFDHQGTCEEFLKRISPKNIAFIRRIEITNVSYASRKSLEIILNLLMSAKNFEQLVLSNTYTHCLEKALRGNYKPKLKRYDSQIPEQLAEFLTHHSARRGTIGRQMIHLEAASNAQIRKRGHAPVVEVSWSDLSKLQEQILEAAEAKLATKTALKVSALQSVLLKVEMHREVSGIVSG